MATVQGSTNSAAGYGVEGTNSGGGTAIFGQADSSSGLSAGIQGANSGSDAAVLGNATGTGPAVVGLGGGFSTQKIPADSEGVGVYGISSNGPGVLGTTIGENSAAVRGDNNGSGPGVYGVSRLGGPGVLGGQAPATGVPGIGVQGVSHEALPGVEDDNSEAGPGVVGRNTGQTETGPGVVGLAGRDGSISAIPATAQGAGVFGASSGRGGIFNGGVAAIRLIATVSNPPAAAGAQIGDLAVDTAGNLWFFGGAGSQWHRVRLI